LGKPVLVLRETTERQEAVDAGTAKLIGTNSKIIFEASSLLLSDATAYKEMATAINPFGDGRAAERIIEIVKNYLEK
jgi:UDP-N-acetylglucosamine 2-epimerase (non-hydrolysing)